jgi:serine/threonine protein kinase
MIEEKALYQYFTLVLYLYSVTISPELRDLLTKLLQKDPAQRMTITDIRQHPWILKTARPLPSREENCAEEISVSEDEIKGAFKQFYTPIHILVSDAI